MRTALVGSLMVVVAALLACKQSGNSGPAPSASAAPAEQNDPRYTLRFGVPKSETDPEIDRFPEKLTTGHIGYKLTTSEDQFPADKIRNTMYMIDGGERQQLTRSESDIGGDLNVFYKTWKLPTAGTYEVLIEDVATGKTVAVGRFRVEE